MEGYKLVPVTGSVEEPVVETPAPAPSPDPKPEETPTPEPKVETEQPKTDVPKIEPDLLELPDGRKVDGKTLAKEWKDNFYPEFTRKSQELADLKRAKNTEINKPSENDVPDWKKPDYVPETYAELAEKIEQEVRENLKKGAEKQAAEEKALADAIEAEIAEIKKADPSLDENLLFQHANKFGFRDLKAAHANYREMKNIEIITEQRVLKNIQTRKEAPVNDGKTVKVAPSSGEGITYDPANVNLSASEYLQSLKKK